MATALKKRDEEIVKRITAEKDAEMATALKKRDEEIVTALKKRDAKLSEKEARIQELEKLLADNGIGANFSK